ncbi:MAG: hypothetical protein MZU91_07035 [Desulfosudis oleivorans]|nr:hypothetical protein [Desulfosudis oleivorans]
MLKGIYVQAQERTRSSDPQLSSFGSACAELRPLEDWIEKLALISAFNIEARYPDLQRSFRKKSAPRSFAQDNLDLVRKTIQWLKAMMT